MHMTGALCSGRLGSIRRQEQPHRPRASSMTQRLRFSPALVRVYGPRTGAVGGHPSARGCTLGLQRALNVWGCDCGNRPPVVPPESTVNGIVSTQQKEE